MRIRLHIGMSVGAVSTVNDALLGLEFDVWYLATGNQVYLNFI